ncbi:hypothetical protein K438DRAFT_1783716 [Mycena galopus ATCC 62051]|nr:hypothetical protein K438DRAFT_1783716 [Mycena galopus ATCC 62051]
MPTWFTDGSLMEGAAGGAVIGLVEGRMRERILLPLGKGQVVEGKIKGLLHTMERAIILGAHRSGGDSPRSPTAPDHRNIMLQWSSTWSVAIARYGSYSVHMHLQSAFYSAGLIGAVGI